MRFFLLLAIITLCFSCTSYQVEKDLSMLCEEAEKINQDTSIAKTDKVFTFAETIYPLISSRKMKGLFQNISYQSDPKIYSQLKMFAITNNVEDWSCEALEILLEEE